MTLTPMYRIAWRSRRTGASGAGTGLFTLEEAQAIADKLNKQDADIQLDHWAEFVVNQATPAPATEAAPVAPDHGLTGVEQASAVSASGAA